MEGVNDVALFAEYRPTPAMAIISDVLEVLAQL